MQINKTYRVEELRKCKLVQNSEGASNYYYAINTYENNVYIYRRTVKVSYMSTLIYNII